MCGSINTIILTSAVILLWCCGVQVTTLSVVNATLLPLKEALAAYLAAAASGPQKSTAMPLHALADDVLVASEALTARYYDRFIVSAHSQGWVTSQNQLGAGHWKAQWKVIMAPHGEGQPGLKED